MLIFEDLDDNKDILEAASDELFSVRKFPSRQFFDVILKLRIKTFRNRSYKFYKQVKVVFIIKFWLVLFVRNENLFIPLFA